MARVPETGPGRIDLWRAIDEHGQDARARFTNEKPEAWIERQNLLWRSFEPAFGEDPEDATLLEVLERVTQTHALLLAATYEDYFFPAPEPLEAWLAHVVGHDPTDLEGADGLDQNRVDAGGVIGNDDQRSWRARVWDMILSNDFETVDHAHVEASDAVEHPGLEVATGVVVNPKRQQTHQKQGYEHQDCPDDELHGSGMLAGANRAGIFVNARVCKLWDVE